MNVLCLLTFVVKEKEEGNLRWDASLVESDWTLTVDDLIQKLNALIETENPKREAIAYVEAGGALMVS